MILYAEWEIDLPLAGFNLMIYSPSRSAEINILTNLMLYLFFV